MTFKAVTPLNEFITLQRGFDLPSTKRIAGHVPVIASSGIGGYHNENKVKGPGVVIGRSGSIGGGQYIESDFWPLNTTLWVKDFKGHNPKFVYYLLRNIDFSGFNTGSGVPTLNRNHLGSILVPDITLSQEKEIADTLSALDDKISSNILMNKTLERIAQRIFKSWFIDFDPVKANAEGVAFASLSPDIQSLFPSEFIESEMGSIPKGWEVSTIGKEFDVTMGQSPPGSSYNETGDGTLFFQGRRDFGFRYPAERVYTNVPKRLARAGDTLLSVRAPVGDVNKALKDCCIGRGVGALRHKSGCESYTYYSALRLRTIFESYDKEGTVFGSINQTDLKSLSVISPNEEVLKAFNSVIEPLDKRITVNTHQINSLTKIRDKLLPKLIKGSIEIKKENNVA